MNEERHDEELVREEAERCARRCADERAMVSADEFAARLATVDARSQGHIPPVASYDSSRSLLNDNARDASSRVRAPDHRRARSSLEIGFFVKRFEKVRVAIGEAKPSKKRTRV